MGLQQFWKKNKVLIVMIPSLVLIHLGWYNLRSSPLLQKAREESVPEPGIVTYVLNAKSASVDPPAAAKTK